MHFLKEEIFSHLKEANITRDHIFFVFMLFWSFHIFYNKYLFIL